MLNPEMIEIIRNNSAGMVATVNADGSPAVSPKGTFITVDQALIAFGNIRSPGTVANLHRNPRIEICFLDVLSRKAVRVAGTAEIVPKEAAQQRIVDRFADTWSEYLPFIKDIVVVSVRSAKLVLSPAYDLGYSEEDLRSTYRHRLAQS